MILSPYNAPTRVVDGRVVCEPRRKKVILMAFSWTAGAVQAFQASPDYEIWWLNHGYCMSLAWDDDKRLRADRWFELHPVRVQPQNDLTWLHVCPVPIYVLDMNDPVPGGYSPTAVQFPREACENLVGMREPFWACTFSYQIALAILEGFEEIMLVGFDFATPREWLFERPNVLFWAGFAAGRGIKLTWPQESTIFSHPYAYGYDYEPEIDWCKRGVDWLTTSWGYVETPEAKAKRLEREHKIQEAIIR